METHHARENVTGAAGYVETGAVTVDPEIEDGPEIHRMWGVDEGVTGIHVNVTWNATVPEAGRLELVVTNDRVGNRETTNGSFAEVRLDSDRLSVGQVEVTARRYLVSEDTGWLGVAPREPVELTVHVLYHGATLPE